MGTKDHHKVKTPATMGELDSQLGVVLGLVHKSIKCTLIDTVRNGRQIPKEVRKGSEGAIFASWSLLYSPLVILVLGKDGSITLCHGKLHDKVLRKGCVFENLSAAWSKRYKIIGYLTRPGITFMK